MADASPEALAAFARHEREIGLQRLRLGCWIAMALIPAGFVIDFLYYKPNYLNWWTFLGFRLICSLAIIPILLLSQRPFGARHYRLLGVLLALAPAACMAFIIFHTDQAASPYYAGLNLILLGVAMVMQWTVIQSLTAVLMVFALYLGAVIPRPDGAVSVQPAHILDLDRLAERLVAFFPSASSNGVSSGHVLSVIAGELLRENDTNLLAGLKAQRSFAEGAAPGSSAVSVDELRDASSLASKLKSAVDPVSDYIQGRLGATTKSELNAWEPPVRPSNDIQLALVQDLNAILEGDLIWDASRFAGVVLREQTRTLLESRPTGAELVRLNRLLLEDAYPRELSRTPAPPPTVELRRVLAGSLQKITESTGLVARIRVPSLPPDCVVATNLWRQLQEGKTPLEPSQEAQLSRLLLGGALGAGVFQVHHWSSDRMAILVSNLWFMALTAVLLVIGSHVGVKLRLSDFVLRIRLDASRGELQHSNERLEETNCQLEHTNQRLRELDELKGRFFANISHELRTPLTLLLGPVDSLLQHPAITGDERLREYAGTMHDNGLRLLKLINDLLDLVRLDAGQLRLQRVRVNVPSFTAGLLNAVRRFAEDRGLRVSCKPSPELEFIVADPDKLEKILLNLLFNSIKFTPAGGEVSLVGWRDGDTAVFEVQDTGMGISPENLSQLFQRFWQADSSAHRKYQGAGIGLALVKELVQAHGGEVTARSEVGKGTTMIVRLPIGPVESTPTADEVAAGDVAATSGDRVETGGNNGAEIAHGGGSVAFETRRHLAALYKRAELQASITPLRSSLRPWAPGPGGNRPEVLVVDDEPDMLRFLRGQLEDDYQVREAVDGDQATSMAAQYLPDAVVCDMMLPEKDGLQVCRELRANHTTRAVPFLMLTARADDETKLAALSAGASDFLAKPFSTAELKVRLKNLVDAQRLQKELSRQNRKLESTLEELRDTESQLVQAEKMASLGRLSAGIIHEINNPLNFARTGLHVLSRHGRRLPEESREEFEEVLRDISDGITRVSTIVGDLRQFSHPQADGVAEVDVAPAVQAALRFLSTDWKDGRAEMINDVPDDFTVYANRNKLVQVLLNLCQNAFDAMRENPPADGAKPCVRLRAWRSEGRRYVSVRDNGPGIPANHLAHIFEPFYTTKEVGKGMGLGLSICYRIMEEVGGRITVQTEAGRFSEFILDFPDRLDDKQPAPGEETTVSA